MLNRSRHVTALVAQRAALNAGHAPIQFSGRGDGGKKIKSGGAEEIVRSYQTYVSTERTYEEILAAARALMADGIKLKKGHGSADSTKGVNAATAKTNDLITNKLNQMKGEAKAAKSRKGRRGKGDIDEAWDYEAPEKPRDRRHGDPPDDPGNGGGDGITA